MTTILVKAYDEQFELFVVSGCSQILVLTTPCVVLTAKSIYHQHQAMDGLTTVTVVTDKESLRMVCDMVRICPISTIDVQIHR